MDNNENVPRKKHPRDDTNFLSWLIFGYTGRVLVKGFKKDLEYEDLYEVVECCQSKRCVNTLEKQFYETVGKRKRHNVYRLLWNAYGKQYIFMLLLNIAWKLSISIMEPQAVSKVVAYFGNSTEKVSFEDAITYAGILVIIKFLHCFFYQNYQVYMMQLGIQMRTSICSLIYRKALKLSLSAQNETTLGNIVTVITKDVSEFENGLMIINDLWVAVIQTVLVCYLIYQQIGLSSVLGIAIILATVPLLVCVSIYLKKVRTESNKKTSERLQATQEVLSTMKNIKMYTWERIFEDKITRLRCKEMGLLRIVFFIRLMSIAAGVLLTKLGFYSFMMFYIHLTVNASAPTVFYVMRCYDPLHFNVIKSVFASEKIAELIACLNRIENVLNAEELSDLQEIERPDHDPEIEFKNVSVAIKEKEILHDLDIKMNVGLNVITGEVGSGKSSVLKTILKEYPISEGELNIRGRKSYASQDSWIFPSSMRQNILFGEEYDEKRYRQVIKCCALEYDFGFFEKGDATILTDRGQNLSTGQQTRINLARAVYRDSEIYLLDDPLISLDPKVQEQIFSELILRYLKGKLIILVTNNAKHINNANKVIVLKGGVKTFERKHTLEDKYILERHTFDEIRGDKTDAKEKESEEVSEKTNLLTEPTERARVYHEVKKVGGISWNTYKKYFTSGGGIFFLSFMVLMYVIAGFTDNAPDRMLTSWINAQDKLSDVRRNYTAFKNITSMASEHEPSILANMTTTTSNADFLNDSIETIHRLEVESTWSLNFFTTLLVLATLSELVKYYVTFVFATNASINLHNSIIKTIIHAVMYFFDQNLIGNILNRFSQDLAIIDDYLPYHLSYSITNLFVLSGSMIVVVTVSWQLLIPYGILFICFIIMRHVYIPTARSLKRLEGATRSPMVGHLNSTTEALATIRASKTQDILCNEFDRHQDLYTSANYTSMITMRAFGFYVDILSACFVTLIIAKFLFIDKDTAAGDVGIIISRTLVFTASIQVVVEEWARIEGFMTSVERVLEYGNVKVENKTGTEIEKWPSQGKVTFVDVNLFHPNAKYRVLKNISCSVKSEEKIGIVGRTGVGKTSVIDALFRLYDYEGHIYIDDVETKTLALTFLRQHISIIPQEPIIFSGTIRSNIDPLGEFMDEEIWKALRKVYMEIHVSELECKIEDANFSTGHRQLICLARAILRKNRIVVLDEATANIDPETELLIQNTIKENFISATIFIIAHKLQSVLSCHKVMVLEEGKIIEFEDPAVLQADKNSAFSLMLRYTS